MTLEWTGIRGRLVLLVLAIAVPLLAMDAWGVVQRTNDGRRALDRQLVRSTRIAADRIDALLASDRTLLLAITDGVDFAAVSHAANDRLLAAAVRRSDGHFAQLVVLDSSGRVLGASDSLTLTGVALADARRARQTPSGFVAEADLVPSPNDDILRVRIAQRATDADGVLRGTVVASVRIDALLAMAPMPTGIEHGVLTIIDTSGLIVARSEGAVGNVGRRVPTALTSRRDSGGVDAYVDRDGQRRVLGFARVERAPWLMGITAAEDEALAALRRERASHIGVRAIVVLAALLLAFTIGGRIARPLDDLTTDARALSAGSAGHRSRIQSSDEIGVLAGAFNQMAETVERRNALLADGERRYRLLFDSNPLPMWAWDADTMRILAVNEAALEKYGYDRDHFLTRRIVDLLDDAEVERFNRARLPFSEARQSAGTWTHRTADGGRIEMEVITTSSRRLGRASWLSVGIDVTARRQAERALAASEEQLRQSQKMEAIGAFAGGISHDFNNLLTGILGYCDLALLDLDPGDGAHHDVSEIRALSLRGAELTRQILAVSRKQVMQPVLLDANDVLRGLDRLLGRLIGEHIVLETRLGEGIGLIRADAGQLEQVLLNLSANARDAMPTGGTLRVETCTMPQGVARALGLGTHTSWMTLRVTDTGCGMPDEVRQRVFEPFFTTKSRGKGTGLGLALVYAMVEQSGGTIHVESMVDIGSTFVLCFPTFDVAAIPTSITSSVTEYLSGTETILLTEDEDSVRAVTTAALERRGYRVLGAADGEAALQIARSYPDPIHLLLTDVVMPRMNGRELAEAFERQRPETRVLFASGYTDDASLLQGIRTDELSFLQKPFTSTQLLQRVRVALDHPLRVG